MVKLGKNIQILVLLFMFLVITEVGGAGWTLFSTASYSTGYQGAHAQFAGIRWQTQDYTGAGFDTMLHFDPDDPTYGMPDLEGEMTSIFIPSESLSNMPDWIPLDWVRQTAYIQNPVKEPYTWDIGNVSYSMEEWMLRWYFSISCDPTDAPAWTMVKDREGHDKRYTQLQIWFEIDLTPVWYFEGQSNAYYAIAKMQLANHAKLDALDNVGNEVEPATETSVTPSSQGSILPIYYGSFAEQNPAGKTEMDYKGKKLNPDLFTSKVYTYITLANFGTTHWTETGAWLNIVDKWKGDVVTFSVDVTVFVIGEWTVQDIESLEEYEDYGRTSKIGTTGGWTWETFISSPANRLLLMLIIGLGILIAIAILAPSVILLFISIIQSLMGGRRK